MKKIIYRIAAHLLKKQFDTGAHTQGSKYNEWCGHCRATEAEVFLRELSK